MTILSLLLATAPMMVTFAPGSATAPLLAQARISPPQARALALQRVNGTVLTDRLERAGTRWVYTFEIRPIRSEHGLQIVQIDANDGTLVSLTRKADTRRKR